MQPQIVEGQEIVYHDMSQLQEVEVSQEGITQQVRTRGFLCQRYFVKVQPYFETHWMYHWLSYRWLREHRYWQKNKRSSCCDYSTRNNRKNHRKYCRKSRRYALRCFKSSFMKAWHVIFICQNGFQLPYIKNIVEKPSKQLIMLLISKSCVIEKYDQNSVV